MRVRLLPILQLTRMALVFTAIADSLSALVIRAHTQGPPLTHINILLIVLVSFGLYCFGMSLNDIIDRRRDSMIASHRPLPSGRIDVPTAHGLAVALAVMSLLAGFMYSGLTPHGWRSLVLVIFTGSLISFYDFAGKYLVAPGILTLGLIRFFHASIASPSLPVVWHPLLLLNHVTLLSAVAYVWEEKRPSLTPAHWWTVLGGLGLVDALVIAGVYSRRATPGESFASAMAVTPDLAYVALAIAAFIAVAWWIKRSSTAPREAGQRLMLFGLLWLIVYDSIFTGVYAGPRAAAAIALLLPIAYLSVQLMRWWSKLAAISTRPDFKKT